VRRGAIAAGADRLRAARRKGQIRFRNDFGPLPLPAHFEQAAKLVKEEDVAKEIVCGPDRERYLAKINEYVEAGYDHVWLHLVGPDQEGFFRFFEKEVLQKLNLDWSLCYPQEFDMSRRDATKE
jgi:hypothetical protein